MQVSLSVVAAFVQLVLVHANRANHANHDHYDYPMAVDSIKLYHQQHKRVALAGLNSFARGAAITGGTFAGFFLSYQGAKTVMEVQRGQEDLLNVGVATLVAGLPFVRAPIMRQNVPYALMLIALDHFHEELNQARR